MLHHRSFALLLPAVAASLVLAGCTSPDKTAAAAAADAEIAFQQGRNGAALRAAQKAVAARDDVSDYWLLLGRISAASNNLSGAFTAYENVIQLDRGNLEALRLLCQLGLSVGQPEKVDKYADQLLLLTPTDLLPLTMKGGAALSRGDNAAALNYADQVLAKNQADSGALILKGRALAAQGKLGEAAELIERSMIQSADNGPRLLFLKTLYAQIPDRARYGATLKRLAAAKPNDADAQLGYADLLYQSGRMAEANALIHQTMLDHPNDSVTAADILDLWLNEGPDALAVDRIATQAATVSLPMKFAYAQFANEIGRPAVAISILAQVAGARVTTGNADAKSALAYAVGLQGKPAEALGRLEAIIAFDPTNPRALLARSRLLLREGNVLAAIADARRVVVDDPQNAMARLTLADALIAHGDADLAEATLREGIHTTPGDPRLSTRLARMLMANGRQDSARDVLRAMTRAVPMSLRAHQIRLSLDPSAARERSRGAGLAAAAAG
jgi:predicted Zn-dependent protease